MTNNQNQLTDLRIEQILEKVGVFTLDKSQDLQDVAAALRELQERRKAERGSEPAPVVPVNDVTNGKPLTINLPDTSSKAFWSGSGKAEVFHPETYKRWAKEAIERYCAIARIDVEVK
ncbi:hypothetical protein nublan005_27730 [Klebsiella pneumoniae]